MEDKRKRNNSRVLKVDTRTSFANNSAPFHVPHKKLLVKKEAARDEKKQLIVGLPPIKAKKVDTLGTRSSDVVSDERPLAFEMSALTDLIDKKIRNFKDNSFVYLMPAYPKSHELYTPYSLIEVPYTKTNKHEYYTLSRAGMTFWSNTDAEFTRLDEWDYQYRMYLKMVRLKVFKLYRLHKSFQVWRRTIKWVKFKKARSELAENLFLVIPVLAKAILELQFQLVQLFPFKFVDVTVMEKFHLFYFIEKQMGSFEQLRDYLRDYHKKMKEVLYTACYEALEAKGYHPLDETQMGLSARQLKEMMSFTDRANKRKYCALLARFLTVCDYMTITLLHHLLAHTFHDLAAVFQVHEALAPSVEYIARHQKTNAVLEKPREPGQPTNPLILAEFRLKPDKIEIDPSRDVTGSTVAQLIQLIREAINEVTRFQSDSFFKDFTEPTIVGQSEGRVCGKPADFVFILNEDENLSSNEKSMTENVTKAYDKVDIYLKRFDTIRENYQVNMAVDPEVIKSESDLQKLREMCETYVSQMADLEGINETINLGLLQIKQHTFKEEIVPVCRNLLAILEVTLPRLAIDMIDFVAKKSEEFTRKLMTFPEETRELVKYLQYLEKCPKNLEKIESDLKYAEGVLQLMKDYRFHIDDEEVERFLDMEEEMQQMAKLVDDKNADISTIYDKLAISLQKDIKKVFDEIEEVRIDVVKDWLLNENSDPIQVRDNLNDLQERLLQCQTLSQEYRGYQKDFHLDVTRFDTLDLVLMEVKLRQTLWNSAREWREAVNEWHSTPFHKLEVEEVTNTNTKIIKNCALLEKNLPPNDIVPQLKEDAEIFKKKIPTIANLRNPALKTRHWLKIEQILATKLLSDPNLTLATFEIANAFSETATDEFLEIAGQASAEASLEALLKKVETTWKEQELTVLQHRDSRDVYILAATEEIQTLLDESFVNISTIMSSRYVGPIKASVEEWKAKLDLFADTLDEWLSCQQQWIYLSAIFSAPDIQRQLPHEARLFSIVDKAWKKIMRQAKKMPLALHTMTEPGVLEMMRTNNSLLEQITRCLEAYLEVKRVAFPRFFFLSNDELLEILAQTRNPHAVQPHLRKCFDAIAKLEFYGQTNAEGVRIETTDIKAMISPEGERIELPLGLKARGAVEDWLGKVEDAMVVALKRIMKLALRVYPTKERSVWFKEYPNQVVLTVSQQQWALEVHDILDQDDDAVTIQRMEEFERKCVKSLNTLAAIARSDITVLVRRVLCALITVDVHAKDTISEMIKQRVVKSSDFEWLKMLRYYWINETETMQARMSSASLPYFYEYLGAGGVLVITPLTDRCYLCLMGALQMDLGGAPAGPAGTGKTETTKDLAKALAIQCVVFNCSDGLDYKMMGRFFSGLATSGAWCCFDEFNRIDIEVLSVIAQQLITIRNAKASKAKRFIFEGREIKLVQSCAAFITMNPGYAGRTELPDNLKALFRPISMMVPDYALIAEVILYSEGFEESRTLARKMVHMYKLCSEQLSQQDHYDFGMRAVKSVLVMAGSLKRAAPTQSEDITLIAALRDSNLPKFLADDAQLFKGILGDLFPGVELPVANYGVLQQAIEGCMDDQMLQKVPALILKNIQLYETMAVRWGVMLVGPTGAGKTSVLETLAAAFTKLYENKVPGRYYRRVNVITMNPKAVALDELYGCVNPTTMEWKDGLLGLAVRNAVNVEDEEHQWITCDGPVDAVWIENLNTVLDDNKMLCLANSERIKLTAWIHMVFEVEDLAQASPATVSRCGMVYVDPSELGWRPLILSWMLTLDKVPESIKSSLLSLFDQVFDKVAAFVRKSGTFAIHQVEVSKVSMMTTLMESLMHEAGRALTDEFVHKVFIWSLTWSLGGNLTIEAKNGLAEFLKGIAQNLPEGSLWDYCLNVETKQWELWDKKIATFSYNSNVPFFETLVPTIDTTRYGQVAKLLLDKNHPVMFTGSTGVGKSVLAKAIFNDLAQTDFLPVFMNFSAQTSSLRTQEMIESRLEKRKKTLLGPPLGKRLLVFVNDVNMPKMDRYGSQPPIELLRQFIDFGGFYDRDKMYWKLVQDVVIAAACAPPGGGRNPMTARFVRHFALLLLPPPNDDTMKTIFKAILTGFFQDFTKAIRPLADSIVDASVDIYNRISHELLPTPAKSHYVFNLRDLSKCIQGVLQADFSNYGSELQILRLFFHESMRVFHDRLISEEDKDYFKQLMKETCESYFGSPIVQRDERLIFGDFMVFGQARADRVYEEIRDFEKLKSILSDYLDDYNGTTDKEMKLIFFEDAVEHITRLARLLRSERGNGLLVGVAGMGKQSLCRLASHLNCYKCEQIELCRGYNHASFHEDLRRMCDNAGVLNCPTVFLITDTQIVKEEFLEDINNILNSGEVPNLYEGDSYEKVILDTRPLCNESQKRDCSRDEIFEFFIKRVKANLHVVICMSPVGDAFRRRCRMFPSLVNCCTIDWFVKWPPEALFSVALGSLKTIAENDEQCEHLATICVSIHESVERTSKIFYDEMRRYYYTTPSSYLELLKQYHDLLEARNQALTAKRARIATGLDKLLETYTVVGVMEEELQKLVPVLDEQSQNMKELLAKLDKDNTLADAVKKGVMKDEADAKIKATLTQEIADDAARDLEQAMPAFRTAQEALKAINKNDVTELRVFQRPPRLVQFVMESVCILLGVSPDWNSAKTVMSDVNFLKKLQEYDKEHIPESVLKKIRTYVENKEFDPAVIDKVSKVAKSMCMWVIAIEKFSKIYRIVEPKILKQKEAEVELNEVMVLLKTKQSELAEVEAKLEALKATLAEKQAEMKALQDHNDLTAARLNRAARLTSALADEEIRWKESVNALTAELWAVPGDVLVASACVAYLGAFPIHYRKQLSNQWMAQCHEFQIPSSDQFNLTVVLGDPFQMRNWNMHGLPRDEISIENGIIVTQAGRWPLMIDPEGQANRWIRSMEQKNGLKVIKVTDPNLLRTLEICIRQGFPILLEELEETLDPALGPVLGRKVYSQAGRLLIKLGETVVDYDKNFKLYMTTKLPNPHYLPEICIQITLVNFLVTLTGLEDQLLTEIVKIELPEMEKQRSDLILRISEDKQQLLMLEDKILRLLYASTGNILDDEELVETLNESKETSIIIAARLEDTEKTEISITANREKYRSLATRGAILFFVVTSLAEIDPMYQFSLRYYSQVFCRVIELPHERTDLATRLQSLMELEMYAVYENVSRGLFERHKLIFSFLLAIAVGKHSGDVTEAEFEYLLRGTVSAKVEVPEKVGKFSALTDQQWTALAGLQQMISSFQGLVHNLDQEIYISLGDFEKTLQILPATASGSPTQEWNEKLSPFQKLMLLSTFCPEVLVIAFGAYVRLTLGNSFTEPPKNTGLASVFSDTSSITPLVFVLSTGSDPMSALLRFAEEQQFMDKFHTISLGQGQGPAAEKLIEKGRTAGNWVFLQNCHLATSWMPAMENIVRNITLKIIPVNSNFRLFLSSMPAKQFPASVLQNSVKLTNEPPKGLRANLVQSLDGLDKDYFEVHALQRDWRAMVFGICLFHGVILERRKFGALGWNVLYEFNDSDRECALSILELLCARERREPVPWKALIYLNGEITYGGRVTDYWDQRCLRTILKKFSSPQILDEKYHYSQSEVYYFPEQASGLKDFQSYARSLPPYEMPDIFGMHDNANTVFQTKEKTFFIDILLQGQMKAGQGDEGGASDEICGDMIERLSRTLAVSINTDSAHQSLLTLDAKNRMPPLSTVLFQEVDRFNNFLKIIHADLRELSKAIKGLVVMSEGLELIFQAFLSNRVPAAWSQKGFLSTKSLGNWMLDFQVRIDFIQQWIDGGSPASYWICGMFFPQSFLTGTLQTHARRHNIPIDSLKVDFEILEPTIVQSVVAEKRARGDTDLFDGLATPESGVFVHGLFIEAGRWNQAEGGLCEANIGELTPRLPAIWLKPCTDVDPAGRYEAPLYKTSVRAGVLSTTGHSTNFVLPVLLDTRMPADYWILRGTALITLTTD